MVHINEELEAAKAAKAAIDFLLTATPKSAVLATLNKAKYAAVLNLSSGGALNEARISVGIALSNRNPWYANEGKDRQGQAGNRGLDKGIRSIARADPSNSTWRYYRGSYHCVVGNRPWERMLINH